MTSHKKGNFLINNVEKNSRHIHLQHYLFQEFHNHLKLQAKRPLTDSRSKLRINMHTHSCSVVGFSRL